MFYSQRDGTFPETRRLTIKKKDDPRETRSSSKDIHALMGIKIISKEVGNRNSKTALEVHALKKASHDKDGPHC